MDKDSKVRKWKEAAGRELETLMCCEILFAVCVCVCVCCGEVELITVLHSPAGSDQTLNGGVETLCRDK